jgi:hypothetical protein
MATYQNADCLAQITQKSFEVDHKPGEAPPFSGIAGVG